MEQLGAAWSSWKFRKSGSPEGPSVWMATGFEKRGYLEKFCQKKFPGGGGLYLMLFMRAVRGQYLSGYVQYGRPLYQW